MTLTPVLFSLQVQTAEEAQAGVDKKDYNSENVWVRFFSDGTFYPTNLPKLLPFRKHYEEKGDKVKSMKPGKR